MSKSYPFEKRLGEPINTTPLIDFIRYQCQYLKVGLWEVSIQKPKRTNDQNALYQVWKGCLSETCGWDLVDVEKYMGEKFNAENCEYRKDGTFKSAGTRHLDTKQFAVFLDNFQREAATEFECTLLTKADQYFEEFYNEFKHYIK